MLTCHWPPVRSLRPPKMNIKEPWEQRSWNILKVYGTREYEYFKPMAVAEWKSLCTGGSPMHAWETATLTKESEKKDNWVRCENYQEFPGEVGQVQSVHILPKPGCISKNFAFSNCRKMWNVLIHTKTFLLSPRSPQIHTYSGLKMKA